MPDDTIPPTSLFLDLDRTGPIPLYFQVALRIEQAISRGDFPDTARLENEVALAARLGLSRPTVRHAIQELVDKGLLIRRRGVGTQIVPGHSARRAELTSLHDELTATGRSPGTSVLTIEVVPATASVAAALGLVVGESVKHLRRLRCSADQPLAILENWLPPSSGTFTLADLEKYGLYQLLRSRGFNIRVAQQKICAREATADEAAILEIREGSPLLTATRIAYGGASKVVEYGTHCYRPDRHSFDLTLVEK